MYMYIGIYVDIINTLPDLCFAVANNIVIALCLCLTWKIGFKRWFIYGVFILYCEDVSV